MTKSICLSITALIGLFLFQPVPAHDSRDFVGVTEGQAQGDAGIFSFHEMCNAEFVDARMCSSSDLVRNGTIGVYVKNTAWVHPSFVGAFSNDVRFADIGGLWNGIALDGGSCQGWSDNYKEYGLVLLKPEKRGEALRTSVVQCFNKLSVACCARK